MTVRWIDRVLQYVAGLIVLVLTVLLAYQLGALSPTLPLKHPRHVADVVVRGDGPCSPRGPVVMRLLLRRIDVAQGTIEVAPRICVPYSELSALRDYQAVHGEPSVTRAGPIGPVVRGPFARERLRMEIDGEVSAASSYRQSIELRALGARYGNVVGLAMQSLRPVTLPLVGNSEDYPLDVYSLAAALDVTLPLNVIYRSARRRSIYTLPMQIVAVASSDLRSFRIDAQTSGGELRLRLLRATRTRSFVVALLAIPLLLIAMLFRATASSRSPRGTEVVVGAAAVMLALLPIRAVLVPSDVVSLTLVDYGLGIEVALLALLVVLRETRR
jgi:hypothetical protein